MTMWVLHPNLSPDEESNIGERKYLPLPFGELPDLSGVNSPAQARQVIRNLYPDAPPESHTRQFDRFWPVFNGLQTGDIIVVPLKNEIAVAEVAGHYGYEDGHRIPVTWYPVRVPLRKLGKHRDTFAEGGIKMFEITDLETKNFVRGWLSKSYRKFGWVKWLIIIYPLMKLLQYFQVHYH